MSEEKKKMYYYYGGKEKKAGLVKKQAEEGLAPYQGDFDRVMGGSNMNSTISGACRRSGAMDA